MARKRDMRAGGVPAWYVLRFLVGATIVVVGMVASLILSAHKVSGLAGEIHALNLPDCGPVARASCYAEYPATAVRRVPSSSSGFVTVLLHSPFAASTDSRDECFGTACADTWPSQAGARQR
jgi:hypothetical protein